MDKQIGAEYHFEMHQLKGLPDFTNSQIEDKFNQAFHDWLFAST